MIPSRNWFPASLQERVAWFENFKTQFNVVALSLGFVAGDVTAVTADAGVMTSLGNITPELEAYVDAVRQYRIVITEGNIGDPTPAFPETPQYGDPAVVATGIFERLIKLVDRIRAAPAYTPEIGALLGIIPKSSGGGGNTPEGLLKPAIKASESFNGYKFSVNVTRLGQPGFKVQVQRQGQTTWADAAFATSNPCEVTVTPTTPNEPERILVRAILLNKNNPVGEPSDPTYVTVNP